MWHRWRIMTAIPSYGIWRLQILEEEEMTLTIVVPATTDRAKVAAFIHNELPAGVYKKIVTMKNPLQYKKYTYLL